MRISKNLPDNRFIQLRKLQKKPIIEKWTTTPPLMLNEAQQHLLNGYNIGFLLGNGYVGIDCDTREMQDAVEQTLNIPTYTQISAKRKLKQFIFRVEGFDENLGLKDDKGKDLGEILCSGRQIVLFPSKIKDKKDGLIKEYAILNDIPIAKITKEQLLSVILQFNSRLTQEIQLETNENAKYGSNDVVDSLSITQVINTTGLKVNSKGQYHGSNVWHGSETGDNFYVDTNKNLAYCFRGGCDCAISPIKAVALNEGIIFNCRDTLRGEDFLKAKEIAIQKYGLSRKAEPIIQQQQQKDKINIKFLGYHEFSKLKFPKNNFIVEGHFENRDITLGTGASGDMKSYLFQYMAFCISRGLPFLNKFKVKQMPVVWLDKESRLNKLQERFDRIRRGLGVRKNKNLLIWDNNQFGMLDSPLWREALITQLNVMNVGVVFVDTMHRFANYKENSADEINNFYLNVLLPITQKTNSAIVLIHHTTKLGDYRGSSDIKGMVNNHLHIKKDKWKNVWINYKKVKDDIEGSSIAIQPHFENNMFIPKLLTKVKEKSEEEGLAGKVFELMSDKEIKRIELKKILQKNKIEFSEATFGRALNNLIGVGKISSNKRGFYKKVKDK